MNAVSPRTPDAASDIDDVLKQINRYWRASGVPRPERKDRLAELRTHLDDAVADGRDVSHVLGPDIIAFAASWILADRSHPWLDMALRFITVVALLSGANILIGSYLFGLDDFAITTQGLAVVVAGSAPILGWDLIRTNRHRLSEGSAALAGLGIVAMVTVVILVLLAMDGWVSWHVPLPVVVLLFVLAVACSVASWKMRRTGRTTRPT